MRLFFCSRRNFLPVSCLSAFLLFLTLSFSLQSLKAEVYVVSGEYLVEPAALMGANGEIEFNPEVDFAGWTSEQGKHGNSHLVRSNLMFANGVAPGTIAPYDQSEHEDFCATLASLYPLKSCEPNAIWQLDAVPNDTLYNNLWGMDKIQAPAAWSIGKGSHNVVVAVLDTGVDYNHPDLAANIWTNPGELPGTGQDNNNNGFVDDYYGWNFYNNTANTLDDHGHGTHCAGTIGAVGNNGLGVVGVSWNVKIMPVKFLASNGAGTTFGAVKAIDYATENGAHIINASFGGSFDSPAMKEAIVRARDAGVLFVAAAGNSASNNDSKPQYPANYPLDNIISVAASDQSDKLTFFSNYGASTVHLAAPGLQIFSTLPNGGYGNMSGTSMAAPHVAGLAALYLGANPGASYQEVRQAILGSVDYIPALQGKLVTGGRINAHRTMNSDGSYDGGVPQGDYVDLVRFNLRRLPARQSRAVFSGTPGMLLDLKLAVSGDTYYQCDLGVGQVGPNGLLRVLFRGGGFGRALNATSRHISITADSVFGSSGVGASRSLRPPKKLVQRRTVRRARRKARQRIQSGDSRVIAAADRGCGRLGNRLRFR